MSFRTVRRAHPINLPSPVKLPTMFLGMQYIFRKYSQEMDGSVENQNNSNVEVEKVDIDSKKTDAINSDVPNHSPKNPDEVINSVSDADASLVEDQNGEEKVTEEMKSNKTVGGENIEAGSKTGDTEKTEECVTDVFGTGEIMKEVFIYILQQALTISSIKSSKQNFALQMEQHILK